MDDINLPERESYLNGQIKNWKEDVPGGSVAKSLPANVEDAGLIPGLRRSHMLWGNYSHMPQLRKPMCPTLL